jgi:hypothetical protein
MEKRIETILRFMCAVKSDRPIDRRTFRVGISLLDEAIRRILKPYKGSSHPMALSFVDPAARVSVAAHATIVKNTRRRRAIS